MRIYAISPCPYRLHASLMLWLIYK